MRRGCWYGSLIATDKNARTQKPRAGRLASRPERTDSTESLAEQASEAYEMRPGMAVNRWRAFLLPNFKGSLTFRSQIWTQSARNSNKEEIPTK
jgi:hypothetical protein